MLFSEPHHTPVPSHAPPLLDNYLVMAITPTLEVRDRKKKEKKEKIDILTHY
jgi:hypothetical protein